MQAMKIQYTLKPESVDQNKANIRKVMDAIRANPIPGMQYSSFVLEDGQTFVHINMAPDLETLAKLKEVKEFGEFLAALDASDPIAPPLAVNLSLVSTGFDL